MYPIISKMQYVGKASQGTAVSLLQGSCPETGGAASRFKGPEPEKPLRVQNTAKDSAGSQGFASGESSNQSHRKEVTEEKKVMGNERVTARVNLTWCSI